MKQIHSPNHHARRSTLRKSALSIAVMTLCSMTSSFASAEDLKIGNADVVVRWDNTVRYNYGIRMQEQNPALLANPNTDDGNRNFGKGQTIANRLDLLSEFDLIVDKNFGLRVSGTAWADDAYRHLSKEKINAASYNGLAGPGNLNAYTKRYAQGVSGEVLDAFVFANFDAGDTPVNVRAGRHTAYWGEGLMLGSAMHGVSYGQYSLDLWKAYSTPGAEAKELFRPRNSTTVSIQPANDLSISAQFFFDWEAARLAESGAYLATSDALFSAGESFILATAPRTLRALPGETGKPKKTGDWGISARWSPDWLNGTLGFYARRTSDILPQLSLMNATTALPAAACPTSSQLPVPTGVPGTVTCYINPAAASLPQLGIGQVAKYYTNFGSDIGVFGLSLSQNVAGLSVGAELSMRTNMPLNSAPVFILPDALAATRAGFASMSAAAKARSNGEVLGARGETMHGVLNLVGVMPSNAFYDIASLSAELTWNRVLRVTDDPYSVYKGSKTYAANPLNIDAVTRDAFGIGLGFTPSWLSALPNVDISVPFAYSRGLSGNSAISNGGAVGAGSWSVGVVADVQARYNFALRYVGSFGPFSKSPTGAMLVPANANSVLSDRGMLLLTFKATF